jgi:vacuolar-type H+-ATPase subunit H
MNENYENKSPEQIQRDIERTRAEMGDTLDTIRQKLSPGQLLDEALDYLKRGGTGQFFNNLGDSVQQNPIPVSLIGIGVAWMMIGGARDPYTARNWTIDGRTHGKLGEGVSSATAKAGQVIQGVRERASDASGRLGEMAHGAQERVSGARERLGEMAHSAQERMGEASERFGEMAYSARHQIGEAANRIRYQTVRARDTYNYLRTEQPLILGVLGFAFGAALGAGIPPTRQEDELMGETRDEYVHRAKEIGGEQLEKAKQMVTEAGEAVIEQAEREGLTSEGTDQQPHETAEKPLHEPPASRHAMREEPAKQGLPS